MKGSCTNAKSPQLVTKDPKRKAPESEDLRHTWYLSKVSRKGFRLEEKIMKDFEGTDSLILQSQ